MDAPRAESMAVAVADRAAFVKGWTPRTRMRERNARPVTVDELRERGDAEHLPGARRSRVLTRARQSARDRRARTVVEVNLGWRSAACTGAHYSRGRRG